MRRTGQMRGRAFVQGRVHQDVLVRWNEGILIDVDLAPGRADGGSRVDGLIVPGFIDLHVHGGAGADFMDGTVEAAQRVAKFHAAQGTTALAATTLSATHDAVLRAVDSIARTVAKAPENAAEIVAIHLEGPYLNPERAGAQDRDSLRAADPVEVDLWRSRAPELRWHMTVAPEIDGVMPLIEKLSGQMGFAIGHTNASYEQTLEAVQRGASHFTHLFNAMAGIHHRQPGPIGAAFDSGATIELIADGHHVHPAWLRAASRLKPGGVALVTDAMRACGMPDGSYDLYRHKVRLDAGQARLADGTLAGSVLTMSQAVRNMVQLGGLEIESVLPMATDVPARILGIDTSRGRLRVGCHADLLVLDADLQLVSVVVRGTELMSS